jgi:lysophospholipase L1-like esterase
MFSRHVLWLIVLSATATVWGANNQPADPDPNRFAQEIRAFEEWDSKNAVPAEPVLFVGSSTIRLWRTHECFPDLPVINRGFGGAHICDVVHYADRVVLPYKPKVIVFYAGDNDIADGKSAQRVLEDCRRFTEIVHQKLPTTRIVFLAIKPSEQRRSFWPEMSEANGLIRDFSRQDKRLLFADLTVPLLGADGKPQSELFLADKLHLSTIGYSVWTRALTPILQQALASQ